MFQQLVGTKSQRQCQKKKNKPAENNSRCSERAPLTSLDTQSSELTLCAAKKKKTWGFTSTETIKAYWGRGSWGVGNFISNACSLHCHHQNDSALMRAAM